MEGNHSAKVVDKTVNIIEDSAKNVAAGALAAVGKTDTPEQLAKSSGNSPNEHSEKTANSTLRTLEGVADSVPVVGHALGIAHYIAGDTEHGNENMYKATQSAVIIGTSLLTGGMSGVVQGGAAAVEAVKHNDNTATEASNNSTESVQTEDGAVHADDPKRLQDKLVGHNLV